MVEGAVVFLVGVTLLAMVLVLSGIRYIPNNRIGIVEANAEKTARIGIAEAIAIEEQVRAYGGPKFQVTQQVMSKFADAIAQTGVDVVPKILIGGGGQSGSQGSGSVLEALLTLMLSERMGEPLTPVVARPENAHIEATKSGIRDDLWAKLKISMIPTPKVLDVT